jgi:hypothetical protein
MCLLFYTLYNFKISFFYFMCQYLYAFYVDLLEDGDVIANHVGTC